MTQFESTDVPAQPPRDINRSEERREPNGPPPGGTRDRIALTTAIIGLVTALSSGAVSLAAYCRASRCLVTIDSPQDSDQVEPSAGVAGSATISDSCGWVTLFVEARTPAGPVYRVVDLVQVQAGGRWSAEGRFDHLAPGGTGRLEARLTSSPQWSVDRTYSTPPEDGVHSNAVTVRRKPAADGVGPECAHAHQCQCGARHGALAAVGQAASEPTEN